MGPCESRKDNSSSSVYSIQNDNLGSPQPQSPKNSGLIRKSFTANKKALSESQEYGQIDTKECLSLIEDSYKLSDDRFLHSTANRTLFVDRNKMDFDSIVYRSSHSSQRIYDIADLLDTDLIGPGIGANLRIAGEKLYSSVIDNSKTHFTD